MASGGALFVLAFLAKLPIGGDAFAVLVFVALLTRAAFFFALALKRRSIPNTAWKVAAFQCGVWTVMGAAFFKFVVLYQFRDML
jgi:hypothetical protein